jgi:hypothetical protein
MINLISHLIKNSIKYSIKTILLCKIVLAIEFYPLLIEILFNLYKITNQYPMNLELNHFSNSYYKSDYLYILAFLSPHMWIKSIYTYEIINGKNYYYFPKDIFAITVVIFLVVLICILYILTWFRRKIKNSNKTNFLVKTVIRLCHYIIEICFFKIFGICMLYILINAIISSVNLTMNSQVNFGLNIFFIFFSIIAFITYTTAKFIYVKYFNIIVRLNRSYPFDNYFSTIYDYFILCIKILIAVENNLVSYYGEITKTIKMLNFLIIFFSFTFMINILFKLRQGKTLYFINNRINNFRIQLVMYLNLTVIYFIFLNKPVNYLNNAITMCFMVIIIPVLSAYISNIISKRNFNNIYHETNLVIVLLYIMNYKNNILFFSNSDKTNSVKIDLINDIAFKHQIDSIYIQHMNHCKYEKCEICGLKEEVNFDSLSFAIYNQCKLLIILNDVKNLTIKYYDYVKLLFHFHRENEKKIRLYFQVIKCQQKHQSNLFLFHNISLLKSVICLNKKDKSSMFILMNNYEKVYNLTEQSIAVLRSILTSCSGGVNLNYTIGKLNEYKDSLTKRLAFLSKNKNIYLDEYSLVITRFIYESLFNKELTDALLNYSIDQYEERLDTLFTSNYLLMKFNEKQGSLTIINGTKEFGNYHNKPLRSLLIEDIDFETIFKNKLIDIKGYEFTSDFIIKSSNGFIKYITSKNKVIQSFDNAELYIIAEFDIKENELILLKDTAAVANKYMSFNKYKINLEQILLNFSEDLSRSIYLLPNWLKYLKENHINIFLSDLVRSASLHSSKINTDYVDLNYSGFSKFYDILIKLTIAEVGLESIDSAVINSYINEVNENSQNQKQITFKMRLIKEFHTAKVNYNLYRIKHLRKFNYNKSSLEESIITDSSMFEANKTVSTITSSSQISDLNIQKSIKTNIEKNTETLRKFSRVTILFNLLMVIYCVIFLYIGIANNQRFNQLFGIRNSYLRTKNTFFHCAMTILHNTKVMGKSGNVIVDEVDRYLISEIPAKVKALSGFLNTFKENLYSYSFNQDIQFIFNKEITYRHIVAKGNKIILTEQSLKFLDIVYMFLSNCNQFYGYLKQGYLQVNIFKVNGDEILINNRSDNLPDYALDVYELILNYHHFINNFIGLEALLDKEQSLNVNTQLYVTMGLTFALIGLHFILILICQNILRFLNNIINSNDKLLREVFDSHIVKYLNSKLNVLSALNQYYKENPLKSLNTFRHLKKEYHQATRKEKINEIKSQHYDYDKVVVVSQNEIAKLINKESYLSPIKKTLFFSFVIYFIYSVGIYLILLKSFTNIDSTTNYIFVNSKVFNSVYNNAILTKFLILQKETDIGLATYMEASGDYLTNGYLQTSIKNLLNMNNLLIARKKQSDIINYYYNLYGKQMMNCDTRLDLFADSIIKSTAGSDSSVISFIKDQCNKYPIMKTDIDQFYFDYNYRSLHILDCVKTYSNDMDRLIEACEASINELYSMVLLLFRPVQGFIMTRINIEGISEANNKYLVFTFVFFGFNILVDCILCLIVNKYIVNRSRKINDDLTTIIHCLKF